VAKTDQLAIKTVNKVEEIASKANGKSPGAGPRDAHGKNGKNGKNSFKPDAGGKPESIARKLYASVAAIAAGIVARKVVEKIWVKVTGKTPPDDPHKLEVPWAEAVGWSVASGVFVGIARLAATRKAAGTWQRVSEQPPVTSSPRDL